MACSNKFSLVDWNVFIKDLFRKSNRLRRKEMAYANLLDVTFLCIFI